MPLSPPACSAAADAVAALQLPGSYPDGARMQLRDYLRGVAELMWRVCGDASYMWALQEEPQAASDARECFKCLDIIKKSELLRSCM